MVSAPQLLSVAAALSLVGGAFAQALPGADATPDLAADPVLEETFAVDDGPSSDPFATAPQADVMLLEDGDVQDGELAPPITRPTTRVPLAADGPAAGRPAVRLIRNGSVVATGVLGANGDLNRGDVPPGVYSVAGAAGGSFALFSYQLDADPAADAPPLCLLAPAADRPLAMALLARRFPGVTPADAEPAATPGPSAPATLPAPARALPSPFRPTALRAAVRTANGVTPGTMNVVRQFDDAGVLRPIAGAEVFLIRDGRRVATLVTDRTGGYRLPKDLAPGLYTLVTMSSPAVAGTAAVSVDGLSDDLAPLYGASITGLNVVAERPVVQKNGVNPFRTVARRVVQPIPGGPIGVPASDFPIVFGPGPNNGPRLLPPPFAGGPAALGGGGAGGAGGLGGGGLLIPALIGAGIGVAIAEADDDDDPAPPVVTPAPQAQSPAVPPTAAP